jgi:hypothetical protein
MFARVHNPAGVTGCWLFGGSLSHGYGRIGIGSRSDGTRRLISVHVLSYERFKGSTHGLHVHHECRVKNCVNPSHLVLKTQSDHMRYHRTGYHKPFCLRGHERTAENTYPSCARCRACDRDRRDEISAQRRQRYARKKEATR